MIKEIHDCKNCQYEELDLASPPCKECKNQSNWKAKDGVEVSDKLCKDCKHNNKSIQEEPCNVCEDYSFFDAKVPTRKTDEVKVTPEGIKINGMTMTNILSYPPTQSHASINYMDWTINVVDKDSDNLLKDDLSHFGMTHYVDCQIYLANNMSATRFEKTLIHELTHAFIESNGFYAFETFDHEQICEFMAGQGNSIISMTDRLIHTFKGGDE